MQRRPTFGVQPCKLFRQPTCSPNPISSTCSSGISQDRCPRTRYNHYRRNSWRRLRWPRRAKLGKRRGFWKARCPRDLPCEKLGRWIRSPPNPRGSDLADPNDHNQAPPSRAKPSRTPPAGVPTRLQPRAVQLPGRPRPANSAPGESRRSRGTLHAQEDAAGGLRRKPGPSTRSRFSFSKAPPFSSFLATSRSSSPRRTASWAVFLWARARRTW